MRRQTHVKGFGHGGNLMDHVHRFVHEQITVRVMSPRRRSMASGSALTTKFEVAYGANDGLFLTDTGGFAEADDARVGLQANEAADPRLTWGADVSRVE